ncbi:DNAH17 [Cordylochernes scorpioides]|uniref:DNAH17 n=1 Tax=Cordylochernes scorpioides TaxID=51811 RepID=A0ABY6K5Z7_9ARAC|nr:DNAH17 [Cordylochernes scorpioides]
MLLVDQLKNIILSFLHTEGIGGLLVLSENAQGQLIPFNNFPNLLKGKGIYFVKTIYEPISPDNILSGLTSGDLSSSPLEQLKIVTDEISLKERVLAQLASQREGTIGRNTDVSPFNDMEGTASPKWFNRGIQSLHLEPHLVSMNSPTLFLGKEDLYPGVCSERVKQFPEELRMFPKSCSRGPSSG